MTKGKEESDENWCLSIKHEARSRRRRWLARNVTPSEEEISTRFDGSARVRCEVC